MIVGGFCSEGAVD